MEIKGKIAVVTGAASGLGRAIASELIAAGVRAIAVVDVDEHVHEVAGQLDDLHGTGKTYSFSGDVCKRQFRQKVLGSMCFEDTEPSILVPAAGITRDKLAVRFNAKEKRYETYPEADWDAVLEVNLTAPIYWAVEMVRIIARAQGRWDVNQEPTRGAVCFIGSVGCKGTKGQVAYSATKAALSGAAATLRKEWSRFGVGVKVVHPGYCDTPMVQAMGAEAIRDHVLVNTQLGRLIQPEEIAKVVRFALESSCVTGDIWADAGYHGRA